MASNPIAITSCEVKRRMLPAVATGIKHGVFTVPEGVRKIPDLALPSILLILNENMAGLILTQIA